MIIVHVINSGTADLLLHIVQCWRVCEANQENQSLPLILYSLQMMYKYYFRLGFPPIKHNKEGKDIHNEIFNNIAYLSKTVCILIIFNIFL